ncbi:MAG TPA: roadblock/LC7 domain-containing protein [Candidatus Methylomirabilis sp.]|nr:roadblock/LC7 domain-containing protein [Candidatus Methylomirabilis sp.]
MADHGTLTGPEGRRKSPGFARAPRARVFKEIVASLAKAANVRGGLLVTPDGLVIIAELPPRFQVEAVAALGATLGRELELGSARLGRGAFRMAVFAADGGTLFVCGSRPGFLILVGDRNVDVTSVRMALGRALDRLD